MTNPRISNCSETRFFAERSETRFEASMVVCIVAPAWRSVDEFPAPVELAGAQPAQYMRIVSQADCDGSTCKLP